MGVKIAKYGEIMGDNEVIMGEISDMISRDL